MSSSIELDRWEPPVNMHQNGSHAWRSASSCGTNTSCVEIAALPDGGAAIRHSEDPRGPELHFDAAAWAAFIAAAKAGEFDPHATE